MKEKEYYSIGQISKICDISIQTLRYYDKIDLIKPEVVEDNGYRFYTNKHILYINTVQYLKELGLSLDEIRGLLKREDLSLLLRVFIEKKVEVQEKIAQLQGVQKQLEEKIENLNLAKNLEDTPYIELKTLQNRTIAYTRYKSPCNPKGFSLRINELMSFVRKNELQPSGYLIAMYYDPPSSFDYDNADIEVAVPVHNPQQETSLIRTILEGQYITAIHKGPYDTNWKSYVAMKEWCSQKGYEVIGPATEVYIIDPVFTKNPDEFVTELQFRVKKI